MKDEHRTNLFVLFFFCRFNEIEKFTLHTEGQEVKGHRVNGVKGDTKGSKRQGEKASRDQGVKGSREHE